MMRFTEREIFVWWEEPTTGKVVWKYSGLDHGHQYQTLLGVVQRLELCVDSWHYQQKVLYWYECIYIPMRMGVWLMARVLQQRFIIISYKKTVRPFYI